MGKWRYRRTTILAAGLASFLLGLVVARRVRLEQGYMVVLGCAAIAPLLWRRNILSLLSIVVLGLMLGCWRGTVYMDKLLPYRQLVKQPVTIRAVASSDAVYGKNGQIAFDVSQVRLEKPYGAELVGTIGVQGYGEPMIYRGDTVQVTAKLYPTRGARQASLSFATVQRISQSSSGVNKLRREFAAGLQSVLPEPLGSFSLGILIGQRTTLPDLLTEQLSVVGLTHVVAVSGYNLTIMVNMAHRLAKKRSKYQATILTAGLIGSFLLITGSSASIVRAAIVSMISLWAWYYGRNVHPVVLLLLGAVLTAGYSPTYLWSDLGWHLSFLAFAGVLIVAPLVSARFFRRPPRMLGQMILETTAAQIMTLPIIMYVFGRLSLIALLANILVVPLIPIAMALSFLAGLAGMVQPALATWLSWPAMLVMTYMVDVVQILSAVPRAAVLQKIDTLQLVWCYSLIVLVVMILWKKQFKKSKITDRKELVGARYT